MKILYTNFHAGNGGGHVTYIINLAKALSKDHQITVAAPATSRDTRSPEPPGGTGTIMRIGLDGNDCAQARPGPHNAPASASTKAVIDFFMLCLQIANVNNGSSLCCFQHAILDLII